MSHGTGSYQVTCDDNRIAIARQQRAAFLASRMGVNERRRLLFAALAVAIGSAALLMV